MIVHIYSSPNHSEMPSTKCLIRVLARTSKIACREEEKISFQICVFGLAHKWSGKKAAAMRKYICSQCVRVHLSFRRFIAHSKELERSIMWRILYGFVIYQISWYIHHQWVSPKVGLGRGGNKGRPIPSKSQSKGAPQLEYRLT